MDSLNVVILRTVVERLAELPPEEQARAVRLGKIGFLQAIVFPTLPRRALTGLMRAHREGSPDGYLG